MGLRVVGHRAEGDLVAAVAPWWHPNRVGAAGRPLGRAVEQPTSRPGAPAGREGPAGPAEVVRPIHPTVGSVRAVEPQPTPPMWEAAEAVSGCRRAVAEGHRRRRRSRTAVVRDRRHLRPPILAMRLPRVQDRPIRRSRFRFLHRRHRLVRLRMQRSAASAVRIRPWLLPQALQELPRGVFRRSCRTWSPHRCRCHRTSSASDSLHSGSVAPMVVIAGAPRGRPRSGLRNRE